MRKIIFGMSAIIWLLVAGCGGGRKTKTPVTERKKSIEIKYAKDFAVFNRDGRQEVVVYNPWQKGEVLAHFVLVKSHPRKGEIKVPLDSVAVFSATQLNALRMLGVLDKVSNRHFGGAVYFQSTSEKSAESR